MTATRNRAAIGDAFSVQTECGDCRYQYVQKSKTFGQLISVLSSDDPSNDLALCQRLFEIFFPVSAAAKEADVVYLGNFDVPPVYKNPMILKYPVRRLSDNSIKSWVITDGEKIRRASSLSPEEQGYPYAFAVNIDELRRLFCLRWNVTQPYPE